VSGFLRSIGIINAAIWFGAGIFFAAGILPAVFSQEMRGLFHESAYPYYSGAVALALFHRFFDLQYICGAVALLHLLAEKIYTGRRLPRAGTILVLALFALGLAGGLWLLPHMEHLRQVMYTGASPELREQARHSFGLWHGLSQCVNLLLLIGLFAHLLRMAQSSAPGRQGLYYQIP
jgi:hypothetical protein